MISPPARKFSSTVRWSAIFDESLPAGHTLGPGLSVTPSVRVSRFEIPGWVVALLAIVLAGAAAFVFQFALNRKTAGKSPP